jgi:hypothetical protein
VCVVKGHWVCALAFTVVLLWWLDFDFKLVLTGLQVLVDIDCVFSECVFSCQNFLSVQDYCPVCVNAFEHEFVVFVLHDICIKSESSRVPDVRLRNPSLAVVIIFQERVFNLIMSEQVQMQSGWNARVEFLPLQSLRVLSSRQHLQSPVGQQLSFLDRGLYCNLKHQRETEQNNECPFHFLIV